MNTHVGKDGFGTARPFSLDNPNTPPTSGGLTVIPRAKLRLTRAQMAVTLSVVAVAGTVYEYNKLGGLHTGTELNQAVAAAATNATANQQNLDAKQISDLKSQLSGAQGQIQGLQAELGRVGHTQDRLLDTIDSVAHQDCDSTTNNYGLGVVNSSTGTHCVTGSPKTGSAPNPPQQPGFISRAWHAVFG